MRILHSTHERHASVFNITCEWCTYPSQLSINLWLDTKCICPCLSIKWVSVWCYFFANNSFFVRVNVSFVQCGLHPIIQECDITPSNVHCRTGIEPLHWYIFHFHFRVQYQLNVVDCNLPTHLCVGRSFLKFHSMGILILHVCMFAVLLQC